MIDKREVRNREGVIYLKMTRPVAERSPRMWMALSLRRPHRLLGMLSVPDQAALSKCPFDLSFSLHIDMFPSRGEQLAAAAWKLRQAL